MLMKTELRRKRMKLGPTDAVVAESPMKNPSDSAIPSSLPTTQFMRQSSFYSEKPSRNVSKYTKLEERMTQKVVSPPSQKFDKTYVAGSWLTSPRRITPKALFGSLLSPSPSEKAGTMFPRKLDLKSPIRTIGSSASLNFQTVGSYASSATVTTPLKPTESVVSQFHLDSPSHNTRSHTSTGKKVPLSETVVIHRAEAVASPSSLGCQYSRLMSPPSRAVISPDFKWRSPRISSERQSRPAKSLQFYGSQRSASCDNATQTHASLPKHRTASICIRHDDLSKCDVSASGACSEMHSSVSDSMMISASIRSPHSEGKGPEPDGQLSKRKRLSCNQTLSFSSTSTSAQPLSQSVEAANNIHCDAPMLVTGKSHSNLAEENMTDNRKKPRKRPRRQLLLDAHSPSSIQRCSDIDAGVCDNKQSEEMPVFTTLSFGCDMESRVETHDDVRMPPEGKNENMNSDILRQLGSSGIESESSSNDTDLKYLFGRKCSSGFQSLGHISETECCPSPVFPTISNGTAVDLSEQSHQHTASDTFSTSPVFGKRLTQSFAGESPSLSLSGSDRKRTPVPGCAESFSPDVSHSSIAHLMTSPLLDGSATLQKISRNRSSTRRCLDQQMYQSGRRMPASQHSLNVMPEKDS